MHMMTHARISEAANTRGHLSAHQQDRNKPVSSQKAQVSVSGQRTCVLAGQLQEGLQRTVWTFWPPGTALTFNPCDASRSCPPTGPEGHLSKAVPTLGMRHFHVPSGD